MKIVEYFICLVQYKFQKPPRIWNLHLLVDIVQFDRLYLTEQIMEFTNGKAGNSVQQTLSVKLI